MNKTLLIIQREYFSRVKKKSFLITTLLLPVFIFGFIAFMGYISTKGGKNNKIAVIDESGLYNTASLKSDEKSNYVFFSTKSLAQKQASYVKDGYDILIHIKPLQNQLLDSVVVYSENTLSLDAFSKIKNTFSDIYHDKLMIDAGFSRSEIDSINKVKLNIVPISKDSKNGSSEIAAGIGYAMGLLIYMIMLIYGTMVMRGVMEEKTNRIAEVIVSSVKPFQLMLGKIIGIAFVGLTQFILWAVLGFLVSIIAQFVFNNDIQKTMDSLNTINANPALQNMNTNSEIALVIKNISLINWKLIGFSFIFYFLGGYLLYASLFAAVGSLVNEDVSEAQQYTLPITMPIIAGMFIMIQAMKDPNSTIAVFGSMFPLTSPIVMMARIGYGVSAMQLIISMALLVLGFILTTWLSGKIYRTGILMYGKKPSWKEVIKWINKN